MEASDATVIPRVSICVPIYNGAAYLEETLAGIAAQTWRDFEVVIVDDCSTDTGPAIARRWTERDPRFRLFVNDANRGLVGNWNRAVELSRGQWIRFLFQDDLIAPRCLEAMMAASEASQGFVACARDFLYEGVCPPDMVAVYERSQSAVADLLGRAPYTTAEAFSIARIDNLDANIVGEPSVVMIRRDLFDRYGLFDPMLVQICDSEMWTRLASNVGVAFVAEPLVTFRVHGGSTTAANRSRPFRGTILDGVIESWKYCEAPEYAQLRAHARASGRLGKLRDALDTQINIAFYQARDADRERPRDPKIRRELVDVLNRLSGYSRARNRHLLFRMKRLIGLAGPVP